MVTTRSQKLSKKATDVKKNFEQTNKQIKLKKTNANNKQKPNKPSQSDRFKIEISNSIKNIRAKNKIRIYIKIVRIVLILYFR